MTLRSASYWLLASLTLSVAILSPSTALADELGAVSVRLGGTRLDHQEGSSWHPTVSLAGSLQLVGPLEVGAFGRVTARSLPLKNPGFGAGVFLGVRPAFGIFRPSLEASVAYQRLPAGQNQFTRGWAFGLLMGAGVDVHQGVTLSAYVGHEWLLPNHTDLLGTNSWSGGLSLTFGMP
jgi:hypothetical protein